MLARLTADDFEPLRGTPFALEAGAGQSVAADLMTVTIGREVPPEPGGVPRRQPFSLLFRARTPDLLPQRVYPLTHDRLGRFEIFLVPVGRDGESLLLQAVFN